MTSILCSPIAASEVDVATQTDAALTDTDGATKTDAATTQEWIHDFLKGGLVRRYDLPFRRRAMSTPLF